MAILDVTDFKLAALLALKHLDAAGQGFVTRESVARLRSRLDRGEAMPQ